MSEKHGFVYIWRDRKHNRYYVGCHWGSEDDGYVCSSSWMKQAYRHRPHDFRRRILKRGLSRKDMYMEEQRVFSMIDPSEIRTRYYNLNLKSWELWHADPDSVLTVGKKISKANTGKKHGPKTLEQRKAISDATKGKSKISNSIKLYFLDRKITVQYNKHPEQFVALLEQGWLPYYTNGDREYTRLESRKKVSAKMMGVSKSNFTQTEARKDQYLRRTLAAVTANTGTKFYNNGETCIKLKPGEEIPEGFSLGQLPRDRSAQKEATSKKRCGTTVWNDGSRNYYFRKDDPIPPGLVKGMYPRR